MRFSFFFLALASSSVPLAAGNSGHHGSVSDLIAPAVNVALLAGFLIWKLKAPLSKSFTDKATDVQNTLERASLKSKEAALMLENEQRKVNGLSAELSNITSQAEADVVTFEKNLAQETEDKKHKLKTDANMKIQADKKALVDELNAELLNQVIAKTKSTIKTNKDYQSKVSSKLLQGL